MADATRPAGYPATPELDKLTEDIRNKSDTVSDFLAFLCSKYELAKYEDLSEDDPGYDDSLYDDQQVLTPAHIRPELLIHEFFGIDYKKCQDEQDAIVRHLQKDYQERKAGN